MWRVSGGLEVRVARLQHHDRALQTLQHLLFDTRLLLHPAPYCRLGQFALRSERSVARVLLDAGIDLGCECDVHGVANQSVLNRQCQPLDADSGGASRLSFCTLSKRFTSSSTAAA